jgi:hypothetical protein
MRWPSAALFVVLATTPLRAADTGRFIEIAAMATARVDPLHVVVWAPDWLRPTAPCLGPRP